LALLPALPALDAAFWRHLARAGASRGPEWFVRVAPPVVGLVAWALAGEQRRAILANLRRVRPGGAVRDHLDSARTFVSYASCLTEVLGAGGSRARPAVRAVVRGELHLTDAIAMGRGVVFATAHTAGWETVGPLLSRDHGLPVMIAEAAERDAGARTIQDEARRALGLRVAHVGDDPLSALPLVRHLREGGVVALQIDRAPQGVRCRRVTLFGEVVPMPEGPLRLAAVTGAPVVPVFAARVGHRRYEVVAFAPVMVERHAGEAALDEAAQRLADAVSAFASAHPTDWFHFRHD
jgi:KDO2-lipid IV(A) lauroyltransferase